MESLKVKNKLILILYVLAIQIGFAQEKIVKINIESVREDVIEQGKYTFPTDYIKNIDKNKFNVIYLKDLCLVHIPYKNTDTHSSEKFSHIMIYNFQGGSWIFKASVPYYYNLKLIDEKTNIFFSNNLFCSMDGSCNRLVEISKFDGKDLYSLIACEGYNNILYLDRLLVFGEKEKVLSAVGDTICNDFIVSEIKTNEEGLDSYELTQKTAILKNIDSDTLRIIKNEKSERIIYLN